MERWERIQKPPALRGYDYPSFSSTLLDSIYRSIDNESNETKTNREAPDPPQLITKKKQSYNNNNTTAGYKWAPPHGGAPDHNIKKHTQAVTRPHHQKKQYQAYSYRSSDSSTFSGFSSSEPESAPVNLNRLKPIQTRPDSRKPPMAPVTQPPDHQKKGNLNNTIRSKLRELKKSQARSPASPAAKLAGFLNSLFTNSRKLRSTDTSKQVPYPCHMDATHVGHGRTLKNNGHRHTKMDCVSVSSCQTGEESTCSSTSSYARSCLVKTPSDNGGKRSVRFQLPAEIGDKKMTWRGFEEEEDDDMASDSSSDLFELENLSVVGKYRNELPVYETTYLGRLVL